MFSLVFARRVRRIAALGLLALALPVSATDAATVTGFSPQRGEIGAEVKIIGTGLGSVVGVEFGGADASFRIVTSTLVRAWVPEGASSGPIRLVLANETLASPIEFTVGVATGQSVAFASPWPNPSAAPFRFSFSLPSGGPTRLTIHDVRGARIRNLVDAHLSSGPHDYTWDGLDDRSRRVPRGLYFARLDAPGAQLSHRLVVR
jgi:hypothetical protein